MKRDNPDMVPAVILAVLSAALLSPGLLAGPSLDPSVFTHLAGQLLDGRTLYVDAWDHKPPGIYLLYALGQAALPFIDPWVVTWLLSVIATTAVAMIVSAILRQLQVFGWPRWAAAAAAVVVSAQYLTALGGGLTEPVAAVPLAAALLILLQADRGWRRSVVAGALLGVTVLISLTLLGGVIAVAGMAVIGTGWRARTWSATLAAMTIGGLVPVATALAWLAVIGALPSAVDALVGYSAAYRLTNQESGLTLSGPVITWTLLSLLLVIAPAILGALRALRDGGPRRQVSVVATVWMALSVALFFYQGRFFAHYAIPFAVPLAVLAGVGLDGLRRSWLQTRRPVVRAALAFPLVLSAVISIPAGVAGARFEWLPVARDHERSERVAEAIREISTPDDSIWVWGNETQLYLLAQRPLSTPYDYLYPLVTPRYSTEALIATTLHALEAQPPVVIVDAGSRAPGVAGFQELIIPRPLTSDGRNLDILDTLRAFVRGRYDEVDRVDGWVLYRLRGAGVAEPG